MRKIKIVSSTIIMLLSFSLFIACDKTEDNFGDKSVKSTNPSINVEMVNSATLDESDGLEYAFKVTLSGPQIIDVVVNVSVSGTGTEGEDYELSSHEILIPKGQLTAGGKITFLGEDNLIEDAEDVILTIGDENQLNATIEPASATYTITDTTVPADLKLTFTWDNTFDFAGTTYHLADDAKLGDVTDFDFFAYDESDNEVTGLAGATGAEPESFTLAADLPDGIYFVTWNAWAIEFESDFNGQHSEIEIPLKVTLERATSVQTTPRTSSKKIESLVNGLTTDDRGYFYIDNGVSDGYAEYLFLTIVKNGNTFEIIDSNDDSLGEFGRRRPFRTQPHAETLRAGK